MTYQPKVTIISGGTATNGIIGSFESFSSHLSFILPISDNGGSTSELIRFIGGPAIGDIRSRLIRLVPESEGPVKRLLSFRLSSNSKKAKNEWDEIVDGSHELWSEINPATREIIRAFLIHCNSEILKRSRYQFSSRDNMRSFQYELANIGNLFLTGARLFVGSLDGAIELFSKITGISKEMKVLPCINTNFTYHISAALSNGTVITGQSQISHPSEDIHSKKTCISFRSPDVVLSGVELRVNKPAESFGQLSVLDNEVSDFHARAGSFSSVVSDSSIDEESGNIPQYIHPELKKSQLHFNKSDNQCPLLSPIERIFYISPYGEEICPVAYNRVVSNITNADVLVYSIGSLMTSVVPVLILKGVGKAIINDIQGHRRIKILLLNGSHDRETSGMAAKDFLSTIVKSITYSLSESKLDAINAKDKHIQWSDCITHIFYIENPEISVDKDYIEYKKGIKCIPIKCGEIACEYDSDDLSQKLEEVISEPVLQL